MVRIGDIIKTYKVTGETRACYVVIDSRLTEFIGYEIEIMVKKKDIERIVIEQEKSTH